MSPFYENPEACEALKIALRNREGRPWRHTQQGTEGGYNCWHLVYEVHSVAGVDTSSMRRFPAGSLNWGKFNGSSRILDYLHEDPSCRRHVRRHDIEDTEIMCGDLLAVVQDRSCNHLAIAESANVAWQIPRGGRVGKVSIKVIRPYIRSIYRIYT